ncbi:MAG: arylesterase [Gammaproteobacteria bacterium]|nr:arylesterase [Gammaproteobacteria bacterium]
MLKWIISFLLLSHVSVWSDTAEVSQRHHEEPVILVIGDSLSSAYGIDIDAGWVALLQSKITGLDCDYKVLNASVTGDTTAGGLTRLKKALVRHQPALVVLELGGNDGLRGTPLSVVEKNLSAMIEHSSAAGAGVALLGMRIPVNYGPRYARQFHDLYRKLAAQYDVPLTEFFMEGVALNPALMQADGIHPNAQAQPVLLANAWPAITQALGEGCQTH